jgi:hypothetical protein
MHVHTLGMVSLGRRIKRLGLLRSYCRKSSKKKKKQGLRDMIQAKADQSKGGNSGRSLSDFLSSL